MKKQIYFNTVEFKSRLLNQIGDETVVDEMILFYERYYQCLGLTNLPQEQLFSSDAEMDKYSEIFHTGTTSGISYDPGLLIEVMREHGGVSKDQADIFYDIEEAYMIEIGAM